ncbi:MAG: response regulator [Candidatus Hydrogenedentes bacterium]|nr:response regulator [Candidatus Hydrogenedentota bacterium]
MISTNKILVVDDEAVIRELLSDILEDDGYPVETTHNGPSALDLLRKRDDFVLLFTDIMMPDMDGIQLIREARKIRPTLIPIVMTGFATLETARAAVKEGAYDYVLKPFSLSEVKLAVANAIERYRLATEKARLRELTEIFAISESMASIREEPQLLDFVLRAALNQVGAYRGSLMVATEDGESLEVAASQGLPAEASTATVRVGEGISGQVARSGDAILVEDIRRHPDVVEISRGLPENSFVSLPLRSKLAASSKEAVGQANVVAVLNICGKHGNGCFSDADLKTLSIVANHAAAALDNVRRIRIAEQAHLATLQAMAQLLEARDAYLNGHSAKVRDVANLLAECLELGAPERGILRVAALFHDIGNLGIETNLLAKEEPLSSEEMDSLRKHTLIGYDILKASEALLPDHVHVVRSHHERMDGSGYPDGLTGDEIPLLVRIMSAAEAYVAMASDRPYRKALSSDRIMEEFRTHSGTQFDSRISQLIIELIRGDKLA